MLNMQVLSSFLFTTSNGHVLVYILNVVHIFGCTFILYGHHALVAFCFVPCCDFAFLRYVDRSVSEYFNPERA
jgi:hypothetical protein